MRSNANCGNDEFSRCLFDRCASFLKPVLFVGAEKHFRFSRALLMAFFSHCAKWVAVAKLTKPWRIV